MDFDDIPAATEEQFVIDDVDQGELPPPVPEAPTDGGFEQSDAPYQYIGEPEPAPVEDALT